MSKFLPTPQNDQRLSELRNCHKGRRAFLLGNGPSLRMEDLERLQGEVTFASNKIYLAFDQLTWRPTYITACDAIVARNIKPQLSALQGVRRIFGASVSEDFKDVPDTTFVNWPSKEGDLEWNPIKGFRAGHSVVNLDIKLAHWMGCSPLYVIGLDFNFIVPKTETGEEVWGNKVIVSEGERNHFHPGYRAVGETWTIPKLDNQLAEFTEARRFLNAAGVEIYNASRFSKLDAWPRVNFDDLFPA